MKITLVVAPFMGLPDEDRMGGGEKERGKMKVFNKMFLYGVMLLQLCFSSSLYATLEDFENPGASLSLADVYLVGENVGDYSGYSVSDAGDVDGDGKADLLIGARNNNEGGTDAGKTYLILAKTLGSSNTIDLSLADYAFIGEDAYDYSGYSVSGAGDVDGDGKADLLIGAAMAGKAYLILAKSLGSSKTIDLSLADYTFIGDSFSSVSGAGDVDGDGKADILIGELFVGSGAGETYLILAKSLGSSNTIDLSLADYAFVGENAYDYSGYSVSGAGDVDGDGKSDLLIGARSNDEGGTDAGKTYLILAKSLGSSNTIDLSLADYTFIGENADDYSGYSVSDAGDVDGDGKADILIGAYGNDEGGSYAGKTYLILAKTLGSSNTIDLSLADYAFIGENEDDQSGGSVSGAGDVDGDGKSDLLIGAYGNDEGGSLAGKTYLILAKSLGSSKTIDLSLADYAFIGENEDDHSGYSVSSAGDVDGNGKSDLLIGAYGNDEGGSDAGKSYLIFSWCTNVIQNGGADQADTSWVSYGGNIGIEADGTSTGDRYFYLDVEGDYFYQDVTIPAGTTTYSLSAQMRCKDGTVSEGFPYARVELKDSSSKVVAYFQTAVSKATSWTLVEKSYTPSSTTAAKVVKARVWLKRSTAMGKNDKNEADFDDVTFKLNCK
ncbi:MAG: FG-GAP repeat protein [Chlamydiae bacterium]|nr:FG-GAP repeat protein [Chlamydiota bacterium]